jgi:hypothetical protein
MTDQNLTRIAFLLDRSGSMQSIKTDIEGGFDAFIEEQRKTSGECTVTLAQFDNEYEVVYASKPLAEVPKLDLQPRGMTALLDAMGRLITETGSELAALPEDKRPGTVIVAIMTDGLENASREWNRSAIKALVEQQTKAYNWEFLYMGADQDAVEVGTSLGVDAGKAVTYSRGKSRDVWAATAANVASYREAKRVDAAAPMVAYSAAQRKAARDD